jgi:Family of unknown function (DUF5335)
VPDNNAEVAPEEWRKFFQQVSDELRGYDVTIEVLTDEYGDEYQAEKLPFNYLAVDNKDDEDVFIVAVGGRDRRYPPLHHLINHPTRMRADALPPDDPWTIDVEEADGTRTIVTFHSPPALPPASG